MEDFEFASEFMIGKDSTGKSRIVRVNASGEILVKDGALTERESIVTYYQERNTTIAAGALETVYVIPNPGKIARLQVLRAFTPTINGATGTNALYVNYKTVNGKTVRTVSSANGANGASALVTETREIKFDEDNPLLITAHNLTNMAQNGIREYYAVYTERSF